MLWILAGWGEGKARPIAECPEFRGTSCRICGQAGRGLAVIGFSLGVYYALDLAAADPEQIRSVVIFNGTGNGDYSS